MRSSFLLTDFKTVLLNSLKVWRGIRNNYILLHLQIHFIELESQVNFGSTKKHKHFEMTQMGWRGWSQRVKQRNLMFATILIYSSSSIRTLMVSEWADKTAKFGLNLYFMLWRLTNSWKIFTLKVSCNAESLSIRIIKSCYS